MVAAIDGPGVSGEAASVSGEGGEGGDDGGEGGNSSRRAYQAVWEAGLVASHSYSFSLIFDEDWTEDILQARGLDT